jgi:hypothetical protein
LSCNRFGSDMFKCKPFIEILFPIYMVLQINKSGCSTRDEVVVGGWWLWQWWQWW